MPRIGFVLTAIAATMSYSLAGCSALMLVRAPQGQSPAPAQTVQFASEPAGADVHTTQGQTCQTPCSLALPVESQSVTFAKGGFISQTIQVSVDQPPAKHSFFSIFSTKPPPTLTPNPVKAALAAALPPPPLIQVAPLAQPAWPQSAPPPAQPPPPPRETIPWFPS